MMHKSNIILYITKPYSCVLLSENMENSRCGYNVMFHKW